MEGTEIAVFLPNLGKHPIQSLVRIDRDDYPLVVRCVLPFHHISAILVIDKEPYSLVVISIWEPIDTVEGTDYAVLVYIANAAGGFDGTLSAAVPLTIQLGASASSTLATPCI